MEYKAHGYRAGSNESWFDDPDVPLDFSPADPKALEKFTGRARRSIEPWLSAVFQSEHLNLLLGSGFTRAIGDLAGAKATNMAAVTFATKLDKKISAHAQATAQRMGRGEANFEDQFRSALALLEGLRVADFSDKKIVEDLKSAIDAQLHTFLKSLLQTELGIAQGSDETHWWSAVQHLQSLLLSFASRAASRERLHIFTSNYDRLIEYGCDLAGLRTIDRFVGALNPVFRSSRLEVDVHYNPPGIRGEPRFMEGVIRLTKLHGSLDWHFDARRKCVVRKGIPFGAPQTHSDVPSTPTDTVMIYPNPAKDVETTEYPYAELFRDFAAALCRPNSATVTYGYGFGDDHINRVIVDMLTIPSTHLVVIAHGMDDRLKGFLERVGRPAQITLLIGRHFANIQALVDYYLPKPALDHITGRMADLLKRRPDPGHPPPEDGTNEASTVPEADPPEDQT